VTSNEIQSNSLEPTNSTTPDINPLAAQAIVNQANNPSPLNPLNSSSNMRPYSSMGGLGGMGGMGGMGGYSSPYSSSYGSGYGGSSYGGSSYGSSYGSYGGSMGSRYGGYGGGYGGMNRYGANNDPNNQGFLENGMRFLDSFNYVVNSLCDVARNLESNADGLGRFWVSIFSLIFRIKNWCVSLYNWIVNLFINVFVWVRDFIKRKLGEWFLLNGETKEEMHLKIIKMTLRLTLTIFILSFMPVLLKTSRRGEQLNGLFEQAATV